MSKGGSGSATVTELTDSLTEAFDDANVDFIQYIRDILATRREESEGDNNDGVTCRAVYLYCLRVLDEGTLVTSKAKELVGVLLSEVDRLQGHALSAVVNYFIEAIESGSAANGISLEIFPKVLSSITSHPDDFIVEGDDEEMSEKMDGNNYASHVISRLSSSSWHPSCIIHIVTLCKDVPLSQKELKCLIERLLREMKSLPVQELPPLTYQLFLLSSKGHRSFILRGIIELFDHLNNNIITMSTTDDGGEKEDEVMEVGTSRDELLRNEGTVLFHLDFALKQNQDLLKEFLKSLKVTQSIFNPSLYTPFTLSLALSLTKVLRYEDIIIDSLKAIIIRCYKENELVAHSKWLQAISQYRVVPDIDKMFSDIVNSSVFGWDLVMKGLINLSLSILDSCCTPKVNSSLFSSNPINNSYHLAANILILSYKSQSMVRREVISQLVNRTLCNSATYVSHYISILAEIIRFSPHIAVEEGSQIKDVFEYMMYVPSKSAIALIRAVLPLVQFKASFRDSLLLTLRKFLFSREVGCRMIAVGGYLLLLKNFKVLDAVTTQEEVYQYFSQSQTYAEHHLSCDSDRMTSNEAFCLEILGTIRRGLSQQDEVKIVLYEGLMDAFEYNIKMAGPIMEFLLNQFNKYYQSDEGVSPPVKLSPCVSNSGCGFIRAEPLPKLIHCIQHCAKMSSKWVEKGVEPIECMDNVSSMLASLRCRMLNCDLNDFELDKSHDRSHDRSLLNKSHDTSHDVSFSLAADSRNYIIAQIVMELYEVLLDYTFTADHINDSSCDVTLKLFAKYHQVVDSLTSDNIKSFKINSLLPMATLSSWMKLLFSDVVPSHQVPLGALRGSSKFVRYIIGTTLVKIKEIPTVLLPWKQGTKHDSDVRLQYYDHLLLMGKIMLDQLINGITLQFNGKKEKVKGVPSLCLEVFYETCHVIVTCYPSDVISFVTHIIPGTDKNTEDDNDKIHFIIRYFQRLIVAVTNNSSTDFIIKDIHIMLSIISLFISHLPHDSSQCLSVLEWVDSICLETTIDDLSVCKDFLSLLLDLNHRTKGTMKIIRKISQDIHFHLGDIDEEVDLSGASYYSLISHRMSSSPTVLGVFVGHFEKLLLVIENVMNIFKGGGFNDDGDNDVVEGVFGSMCDKCVQIVLSFHELSQSALPPSLSTDTLIKNFGKLYSIMSDIIKQQSLLLSKMGVHPRLEKLVKLVGSQLSQQIYHFILYTQNVQSSDGSSKKGKGKFSKVQVKREKKSIPSLIYWMEEFEKLLTKLTKKSKCDLMSTFEVAISRDYKLKLDELLKGQEGDDVEAIKMKGLEEQELEFDSVGELSSNEDEDGDDPTPKRYKSN